MIELNDLKEYAEELRIKSRVEDVRTDFNCHFAHEHKVRAPAEMGCDIDHTVEVMKHLIFSVKKSFNTFRIQLRKFNQKTRIIAKAIRMWKDKKQRLIAALYTTWTDWENKKIEEIQKAYPHRPTGEIKRLIEEELVVPEPALRHRCLAELYDIERRRFHREFSDWHKEKTNLTLQIVLVKKRALVCKVEMEAKRRAREQLRNDGEPDSGVNESLVSVLEELSDLLNERDALIGLEPRFDPSPSEKNTETLIEIAKKLKRSRTSISSNRSFQSKRLSVASVGSLRRERVPNFCDDISNESVPSPGRANNPERRLSRRFSRKMSESGNTERKRTASRAQETDLNNRSWLRKASFSSNGRLNSLKNIRAETQRRESLRESKRESLSNFAGFEPSHIPFSVPVFDSPRPDSVGGAMLPPIAHVKPSFSRLTK